MSLITRILLFLTSLTIFTLLLIYIAPPKTWPEASLLQILIFFIPFIITTTLFANIFLHSIFHSFIFGLGMIVLALLQALRELTIITGPIVIFITFIGIRYFPKIKFRFNLRRKIPKITPK